MRSPRVEMPAPQVRTHHLTPIPHLLHSLLPSYSPPSFPSPSSVLCCSHTWRKAAHVSLNASALALVGFGLFCAFTSQPPPYVFTPHSWLGLASAFLLGLQALGGVLYLIPHGPVDVKAALLPSHAWLGLTAFALSLLTFCSGVVNLTALYLTRGTHHYTAPPSDHSHTSRVMDPAGNESLIACLLGVVALAVLLLTLYAVMPRRAVEWQEGTDVEGSARAWGRPQRPPVSNPFSE